MKSDQMDEKKNHKGKRFFLYFRICFVTAAVILGVIWVSTDVGWKNLWDTIIKINIGTFIFAIAVFALSQVLIGLRWWMLLRTQKVYISIWAAIRLHFLGLFYNNFMPGSMGGDAIRAWYVTKHTHRRFEAALSVLVDRALGFASSVIMAAFCYFVLLPGQKLGIGRGANNAAPDAGNKDWIIWALMIMAMGIIVMLAIPACRRLAAKTWQIGLKLVKKLWTAIVVYSRNPITILAVFALTLVLQGIVIVAFWLVGRHIGMETSIKYYFVFFPLTWALGAIPVSVGGAGVVEGGLTGLFMAMGVQKEQALAIALCQRVVWMLASLPGAFVHLAGGHLPSAIPTYRDGDTSPTGGKEISIDYEGIEK